MNETDQARTDQIRARADAVPRGTFKPPTVMGPVTGPSWPTANDVEWLLDRLAAATERSATLFGLLAAESAALAAATERADKAEAAARDEVGAAIQEQADWLNGRTEDAWLGAVWADVAKFVNNHEAKEQQ